MKAARRLGQQQLAAAVEVWEATRLVCRLSAAEAMSDAVQNGPRRGGRLYCKIDLIDTCARSGSAPSRSLGRQQRQPYLKIGKTLFVQLSRLLEFSDTTL